MLTNTGVPMRAPFACAEEELAAAGMDCPQDQPCPVYLELNAAGGLGARITLAGNLHSASATLDSILLTSSDGGVTWKEPFERIRGASLDQLELLDAVHGWAAGETQYPLARDPFFLITGDGGNSWRRQDVFEDGGPGSVLSFRFDSPDHGELVVDAGPGSNRYTSWESQTGGSSWSQLGAADTAPKIAGGAAGNPDWRVRSARDGNAWEIEKRSGSLWLPAASFLVEVARCTIKPGEVKPPEPDDPVQAQP